MPLLLCLMMLMMLTPTTDAHTFALAPAAISTTLSAGGERVPPAALYRSDQKPVATNQWYSSLFFTRWSQPIYAQPLSYQASEAGWEIGWPQKRVSQHPGRGEADIVYGHDAVLSVQPLAFAPQDARPANISDWALDVVMANGLDAMRVTIAHGSPLSYYRVNRGDVRLTLAQAGKILQRADHYFALQIGTQSFAIFLPSTAKWDIAADSKQIVLHDARYFSIAALPTTDAATLALFARHAYAFPTQTRVSWQYDAANSSVKRQFSLAYEIMQGTDNGSLLGLYPHQWHGSQLATLPLEYDTVRGKIKLIAGKGFTLQQPYHGFVPFWPTLTQAPDAAKLQEFLQADLAAGAESVVGTTNRGTYWEGKALGRAVQLMNLAEQSGDSKQSAALLAALKSRLQSWFTGDANSGRYFYYHADLGTVLGYPDEYGSAQEVNDHHFHYGYWIFAAAQVALRDPQWAKTWGGVISLLARDIANHRRDDAQFPYLRNFDAYEGHSWASGTVPFYEGNNQESVSEAIHAWAGVILWGEAIGDTALRDTGIYLYSSEIEAGNYYWFDVHGKVFAPEYHNASVGILWGNKYVHGTWFTEDPREIHGITLLPLTTASTYLGQFPAFVQKNSAQVAPEYARYRQSEREQYAPATIWQDILLGYVALADAKSAIAQWDAQGLVEQGESTSHTYHWLHSLQQFGQPDFSVTADTPLYAVFRQHTGQKAGKKTYLAYNAGAQARSVRFSDGTRLLIAPHSLGVLPNISAQHHGAPTSQQ